MQEKEKRTFKEFVEDNKGTIKKVAIAGSFIILGAIIIGAGYKAGIDTTMDGLKDIISEPDIAADIAEAVSETISDIAEIGA